MGPVDYCTKKMNYSFEKKNAKRNSATGERMKRQKRDKPIEKKEDEMQCQKSVIFCSGERVQTGTK